MSRLPRKPGCMVAIFSVVVWVVIVGVICAIEADKTWQSGKKPHTIQGTGVTGLADPTANGTLKVPEMPPNPPTLKESIRKLRTEAAKQNLRWMVFCTGAEDISPEHAFMASAEIPGHAWNHYIEDGGLPGFMAYGHTQVEAITGLIGVLSVGPNMIPDPKPQGEHKHKQCPPPIEGGPQ